MPWWSWEGFTEMSVRSGLLMQERKGPSRAKGWKEDSREADATCRSHGAAWEAPVWQLSGTETWTIAQERQVWVGLSEERQELGLWGVWSFISIALRGGEKPQVLDWMLGVMVRVAWSPTKQKGISPTVWGSLHILLCVEQVVGM